MSGKTESKPTLAGAHVTVVRVGDDISVRPGATYSCMTVDTGRPEKLADFLSRRSKAAVMDPITTIGWPRRFR